MRVVGRCISLVIGHLFIGHSCTMASLLSQSRTKEVEASLQRGLMWLLKKQMADGGWHSVTYGGLRDGAAVTSLAVYTFSLLPDPGRADIKKSVDAAGDFLQDGFAKRKTIASPDGS